MTFKHTITEDLQIHRPVGAADACASAGSTMSSRQNGSPMLARSSIRTHDSLPRRPQWCWRPGRTGPCVGADVAQQMDQPSQSSYPQQRRIGAEHRQQRQHALT